MCGTAESTSATGEPIVCDEERTSEGIPMRRPLILSSIALLACLVCAACAAGKGAPSRPTAPPNAISKVARVEVALHLEMPQDEHRDQWEKYSAGPRLQKQVVRALEERDRFASEGDLLLRILVTDFRLRKGGREHDEGTTFWWGHRSGSDSYAVGVEVERAGEIVRSFDAEVSDSAMGTWNISPTERSEQVIRELAEQIASGL